MGKHWRLNRKRLWTPPSHGTLGGPNREPMGSSQPLAYTLSAEHNKGRHACMAVSGKGALRRQEQVSPSNCHCLCLDPMCRACSHLLVHFCELLQPQLTGGIIKKESWTSRIHA